MKLEEITNTIKFLTNYISEKKMRLLSNMMNLQLLDDVKEYITLMGSMHKNHIVVGFPLNKDFAIF